MLRFNRHSLIVFVSLLVSCSLPKAISDHDPDADFETYRTYRICPDYPKVETIDEIEEMDVKTLIAIRNQIDSSARNLELSKNEEYPQLEFGFQIVQQRKNEEVMNCKVENEYDYWPTCKIETYSYVEGTLLVYATDLATNRIVWQAAVEGELENPESIDKKWIRKIVDHLFDTYPINP